MFIIHRSLLIPFPAGPGRVPRRRFSFSVEIRVGDRRLSPEFASVNPLRNSNPHRPTRPFPLHPASASEGVRTYDSRQKYRGDFGAGWTLSTKNVRIGKTVPEGKFWSHQVKRVNVGGVLFGEFSLVPTKSSLVTLTMPDGRTERFKPVVSPSGSFGAPVLRVTVTYIPESGAHGQLLALSPAGLPYGLGEEFRVFGPPPQYPNPYPGGFNAAPVTLLDELTLLTYNPTKFQWTDDDGTVYVIDQKTGVERVTDTAGNTVTFTANGIEHSSGKSITYTRDAQNRITAITDPQGRTLTYAYDANGDLVSFTDRENLTTTFTYLTAIPHHLDKIIDPRGIQAIRSEYDDAGRLIRQIDAQGNVINLDHQIGTRREVVRDRLGNPTTYEYDDNGNVLKKTDPLGAVTTYTYDGRDNLLTETNALGKTTTSTYDSQDNKLTETDPLGNVTRYTYDTRRLLLTVTDPRGNVTTNTYDGQKNLATTRDALNNLTTYTYTSRGGFVTSVTDAMGHVSRYTISPQGNMTAETDALGNVTTYTYDTGNNRTSQTVTRSLPGGGTETLTTAFTYDNSGRVVRTTYPDGTFTETVYNSIGKVSQSKDQQGRTTSYTYDDRGNLSRTTYPDGTFDESTHDAEGRRLTSKDREGRVTGYEYDLVGRLLKTTYPDLTTTESTYDLLGRVLTTKDALGHVTTYEYDPNCGCSGRRTKVIDALGHFSTFAYDQNGNQTSMTDALGHTTNSTYDVLNRRTRTTFHDGTFRETTYDTIGRRVAERDQDGKVTQFTYDPVGRLLKVTDALNQETSYGYNELGQQISQTDALGRTTRYEYDRLGRRVKRILPMGQVETYAYNTGGNLTSRTDFNGKTTTYQYDTLNRLTTKTFDPSFAQTPVSFTYTVSGRRATMTDSSGTTTYTYDNRYRLTAKATPNGTLSYSYNAVGNILTVRSSNADGVSVDYGYDQLNRLNSVTDNRLGTTNNVTGYTFDDVGNLKTVQLPNGVDSAYSYDSLNRLTAMSVKRGTTDVANYAYSLGASGNRLSVAELGGRTLNWTYDALYRLTRETISGQSSPTLNGQIDYTYDAVGNRRSRTSTLPAVPSQSNVTVDDNDRLTTDGYDQNGSTTSSNGKTYTYDAEMRLISAVGGGSSVSIVYDGDGNRVQKTVTQGSTTTTTKYLVDDNNHTGYAQVVEELQGGTVSKQYTFGHDLISQRQLIAGNWTTNFFGYDGGMHVRFLTDSAGAKTDSYDYDAFGNLVAQTGTTPNVYLYRGEQFDPDLGMYFLRARYMNQSTGRFWSMDEYEGNEFEPASLHKYLYANADPVNRSDPSGNFSLVELSIANLIRNTIVNFQANLGFAIMDQIRLGGEAGFEGFGVDVALLFVPFFARAAWKVFKAGMAKLTGPIRTIYKQWAASRRIRQALKIAGTEMPVPFRLGTRHFNDCLELSSDLQRQIPGSEVILLEPKGKFIPPNEIVGDGGRIVTRELPVRKEIWDGDPWPYHAGVVLPDGQVIDPLLGDVHTSHTAFKSYIVGDGEIVTTIGGRVIR